jgi:hypothetical protein
LFTWVKKCVCLSFSVFDAFWSIPPNPGQISQKPRADLLLCVPLELTS